MKKVIRKINNFYKTAPFVEKIDYVFAFLLAGAFIVALLISLFSNINAHPDEYETWKAITYFQSHWALPDIRNPLVYFCIYGSTRMTELTLYYFFAGKVTALFAVVHSFAVEFRIFDLLLFAVMIVIAVKHHKDKKSLLFILLLTPQLWYIFSYATSDAFDFFIAFIILFQLIKEDSMLNRFLSKPFTKKSILYLICVSFLFALQLMSKPNFFTVLLMVFFILLGRLIFEEKEHRKQFLIKCLALLMCSLVFLGLRESVDLYHYGLNKSAIVQQLKEEKAGYQFKPSTPLNEKYECMQLHDRNVSLRNMLFTKGFIKYSFRSFVGLYGYFQFHSSDLYYHWIMLLYLALYAIIFYYCIKSGKKRNIAIFAVMQALVLLSIVLSIYTSLYNDFEPQGRYILPALIPMAYCTTLNKNIFKNVTFNIILFLTCALSLYSFIRFGLFSFI